MRICEIFRSIQGEGLTMGVPTVFVRAVGCNLRCAWCDTMYSMNGGTEMTVPEIMEKVGTCKTVCVTGGEPMLQKDILELLDALLKAGKKVVLETNGSIDLKDVPDHPEMMISMDIKCPSSGMSDRMLDSNIPLLRMKDQLKFIIKDQTDFDYAVGYLKDHPVRTNVIFGPVGGTDKLEWLVQSVLDNNVDARVLPQLHKIIWGDRKGV
ncbi:archaeosine biosynthesis radical SAM domain-containing protein [methanogenic archaeon mixed culture ISO4-G1]|nr:archaeosine biosynthesis radical SAM domain-containing protein [methanogenic archaeon mixed culture ISO4-G1]